MPLKAMYSFSDVVKLHNEHGMWRVDNDAWKLPMTTPPSYFGDEHPIARGLCRIQKNGKWYMGATLQEDRGRPECFAWQDDGTLIKARTASQYPRSYWVSDDGQLPSEYMVIAAENDKSKWSKWGEWSPCSVSCGTDGHTRARSRDCLDKDGNIINYMDSGNDS